MWAGAQGVFGNVVDDLQPAVCGLVLLVVALYSAHHQRSWGPLVLVAVLTVPTVLIIFGTKAVVDRVDPAGGFIPGHGAYSSGHAAFILLCSAGVAMLIDRPVRRWASLVVAALCVLMALSLLWIGLHWVSDVLGGTLVGVVVLAAGVPAPGAGPPAGAPRPGGSAAPPSASPCAGPVGPAQWLSMPTTDDTTHPALTCRACHAAATRRVLDLGEVAASDQFPSVDDPTPDPTWPLRLYVCEECHLVQLGRERGCVPRATDGGRLADGPRAREVVSRRDPRRRGSRPGATVIELDSSHGASWLPAFLDAGLTAVDEDGVADLVVDVHHLMHADDLDTTIRAHARRLAPGGRLVCEFFHVLPVVEKTLIDTIRHGHFLYLSVLAAVPLLARHGLTVTRATLVDVYGGSVRLTAGRHRGVPDGRSLRRTTSSSASARPAWTAIESLEALGCQGGPHRRSRSGRTWSSFAVTAAGWPATAHPRRPPSCSPSPGWAPTSSPTRWTSRRPSTAVGCPGRACRSGPSRTCWSTGPDDVVVLTWDIADEVANQLTRMAAGSGWSPRLWAPLPTPRELGTP